MTRQSTSGGFPMARGVQLSKELSYEIMARAAAAAQLDKFWADTFLTNAGINSGTSTGYTYRGASNYDVVLDSAASNQLPDMTSDSAPSGVCSASTVNGANSAWKFADRDAATGWSPNNVAPPHWWKYDFGAGNAKTITGWTLQGNAADTSSSPRDFKLQGSNDDSAWTDLDTRTGITWTLSEIKTFSFSNSTAYRYYRFYETANINVGGYVHPEITLTVAGASQAVIKSITLTMTSAITSAIVWANTSGGNPDLVRISTDSGSTWTTVPIAQLGQIIAVPSGTGVILEVTISGAVELESWGVAGV